MGEFSQFGCGYDKPTEGGRTTAEVVADHCRNSNMFGMYYDFAAWRRISRPNSNEGISTSRLSFHDRFHAFTGLGTHSRVRGLKARGPYDSENATDVALYMGLSNAAAAAL